MKNKTLGLSLIEAVIQNDVQQVKKLLQQGADPNAYLDDSQITPLHFAAQNNALAVVPLLVAAGANLQAKTVPEGQTPLDIARLHHHPAMVALLARYLLSHAG